MRSLVYAMVVLAVLQFTAAKDEANKPRLLGGLDAQSGDVLNALYKVGLELDANYAKDDIFAIRVCSNDPLPVALSEAKGLPFVAASRAEKLGISKARIYYLRQDKSCHPTPHGYATTEFWLVPKSAELPEFVEAANATHLAGFQLTNADDIVRREPVEVRNYELERLTPQSYRLVLDDVVARLKQSKSALVVIQVSYYRLSHTVEQTAKVHQAQKYLTSNGISAYRVVVKRIRDPLSSPDDEQKYPNIFVVSED